MGKILIATRNEDYINMLKTFKESGYQTSYNNIGISGGIAAYRKLNIDTVNYYEEEGCFAVGVGTFFFNGKIDDEALKNILHFFAGDVGMIQDKIIGSYCICIFKEGKMYIFVDSNHIYNMYYFIDEARTIVTNTYYHIAQQVESMSLSPTNFLEQIFQYSNLDNYTLFDGIKKLMGNQYLELDVNNNICVVREIKFNNYNESKENSIKNLSKKMGLIGNAIKNTGIFMTGGQDSRLVLSFLLSIGLKPTLLYGEGDSMDTNTKIEDKNIVELIAKKLNIRFQTMNWKDNISEGNIKDNLMKYGELYLIYNYNENIIHEFEYNLKLDFVEFGYFGEIFRNIEWLEEYPREEFSIEEIVDDFYVNIKLKYVLENFEMYRKHILDKLYKICINKKLNPLNLCKDNFIKIHIEYRKSADTVMCNFSNLFFYSTPILSQRSITEYVENIGFKEKINSKFQLETIKSLNNELLTIPFYSHLRRKVYDSEKGILKDELTIVMKNKELIRKKVKNEKLIYILRILYYKLKGDKKGLQEVSSEHELKRIIKIENINTNIKGIKLKEFIKHCSILQINRFKRMEYLITNSKCNKKKTQYNSNKEEFLYE